MKLFFQKNKKYFVFYCELTEGGPRKSSLSGLGVPVFPLLYTRGPPLLPRSSLPATLFGGVTCDEGFSWRICVPTAVRSCEMLGRVAARPSRTLPVFFSMTLSTLALSPPMAAFKGPGNLGGGRRLLKENNTILFK